MLCWSYKRNRTLKNSVKNICWQMVCLLLEAITCPLKVYIMTLLFMIVLFWERIVPACGCGKNYFQQAFHRSVLNTHLHFEPFTGWLLGWSKFSLPAIMLVLLRVAMSLDFSLGKCFHTCPVPLKTIFLLNGKLRNLFVLHLFHPTL